MILSVEQVAGLPRDKVFVAGAFDPLHAGHVFYLQQAAMFGPLVCGVVPDSHMPARKHRPALLSQASRAKVVQALKMVEHVVLMDDGVDATVLERWRPQIYVKAAGWRLGLPDAERRAIAQHGVEVIFVDELPGEHSSALLVDYVERRLEMVQ